MPRIFYGWRIVAVAFLTHCITTGIVFYSFGVFLSCLTEHFNWSRAQVSFGFSLVALCGAFYAPFVGRAVDRYGPRPSQLAGAAVMALGFFLLRGINTLTEFYVLMGAVVAFGSTALGPLPSNTAVANWFVRRRGRALGAATAGISMGGVIFVPLTQFLIDRVGWRNAFAALGVFILAVAVPPVALFMRRSPESMGLRPDGGAPPRPDIGFDLDEEIERSWTPAEAMGHRNFWLITAAFALTVMGLSATLLHLITFLRDRGISGAHASWALGATAGVGVVGKLGFGALLDRFEQRRVIMWCFGLQALGLVFLAAATSWVTLSLYVLVYGFAMGGNATLQATILGECFGRLHYGAIAGRMSPFIVFGQALAIPLAGAVRDRLGTYMPAFGVIFVANLVAVACITRLETRAKPPG
ncbi:MAG TPA: MFS transporter [Candidatus Acidoferrales bacterium]|nr:MFS transporter [Candidatus Acidoferrales bacterium]